MVSIIASRKVWPTTLWPMRYFFPRFSTRMTVSDIKPKLTSRDVGEGLLHSPEIKHSTDQDGDGDEIGDQDFGAGRGASAQKRPAESFDHADHRIQPVQK